MAKLAERGAGAAASSIQVKLDKARPVYPQFKSLLMKYAGERFTFPQVFLMGEYQGGFADASAKLEDGCWDGVLENNYGVVPKIVQTQAAAASPLNFDDDF
mmetsp:Transcript_6108/g.8549  ORF Transcript_6108/g.8549 Transcript_6108/m.8549 type:complete len:101 (+) Transcript_6108:1-303(+)